jgi:S1-C subfamily serine protease
VILAGAGHVAFGSGIPKRLERRTSATYAIVLNSGEQVEPRMADYLLLSKKQELPPAGILGVSLEEKGGECRIGTPSPGGAGEKAGLRKGDVLVAIDGQTVKTIDQVHLALWDKKPGDRVRVNVRRKRRLRVATGRDFEVELAAPPKPTGNPKNRGK